ncbi:hypothetical protein [Kocuria sp. CNJ-770]|nr:hypothetical protein [Kocuria sp. CNJ-770]
MTVSAAAPAAATTAAAGPGHSLGAALLALIVGAAVHRWDRRRATRR